MWSLKITTEQRYKYFEPILPDIKTDIKLFWENFAQLRILLKQDFSNPTQYSAMFLCVLSCYKSFIIERTLDNQYQITFYE